MPLELVSYQIESTDLLNATRDPLSAKCVLSTSILASGGTVRWSHLHPTIGNRHAELCTIYTGGREWSRLLSTATHEEMVDRVAAASPAERSLITGPIAQINRGSCNFANLTEGRSPHDASVTFAPKTPADLHSAQPALEALRLCLGDPPFSEAGLRDARSVADEAVPVPASWESLPTSVDVDGQRVQLLMATDNIRSKAQQKSATKATGTGYSRVLQKEASGVLVGYVAKPSSLPTKVFRISGIGLSELRGKITEFKTAKQALIAAATHIAVAERQQMDV
jgi:hypothetical protein